MKKLLVLFVAVLFVTVGAFTFVMEAQASDPVEGFWMSIDENSGEVTAYWQLYVRNGVLYGKIIKNGPNNPQDAICTDCSGEYANKPVVGTDWIKLTRKRNDGGWDKGTIVNPGDGKSWTCRIWRDGADLKVRGSFGPIGRNQTWKRTTDPR